MAVGVSEFNETASFEEYNPHPYQGGYDIVLTYGAPLPPSPAICYPISDAAIYPPLNPPLPPPPVPEESSASPETDLSYFYGYGEQEFSLDWWWNLSPFVMAADGNCLGGVRYDVEDLRFWGQFRRAADYIFGYSQGFGERRIGEDSLGIPIYAYKKHDSDSVHVEVEPVKTEKLSYHLEFPRYERLTLQCSSTYNNNKEDEKYGFSNLSNPCKPQELLHTGIDPVDGLYDEQMISERNWISSSYGERRNEVNVYENLGIDYSTHYYGGAQNVYLEAVESSYHTLDYPEAFQELSYTNYDRELSYKGHENGSYVYDEGREYEQLSHGELEPYSPSWAQYPGYYGINEDVYSQPTIDFSEVYHESSSPKSLWQTSSIDEWGDEGKYYSSEYAFQTHHDDHSLELEPFTPTWMLNPNYYDTYEEISTQNKPVYFD